MAKFYFKNWNKLKLLIRNIDDRELCKPKLELFGESQFERISNSMPNLITNFE